MTVTVNTQVSGGGSGPGGGGGGGGVWGTITGTISNQVDLYAALGGNEAGGPSDIQVSNYDVNGRADTFLVDGLTWTATYYSDGRPNTLTAGSLVRQFSYDGQSRYLGVTGPQYQGGALVLTQAQMAATAPVTSGMKVKLSDTYPGQEFIYDGTMWRPSGVGFVLAKSGLNRWMFGGNAATYSQTGTVVTVTQTAHGFTAAADDGSSIYLTQSTGALVSGWFTGFTYLTANTFSVTSTVSQSTSGNLGTQIGEITVDTITLKANMMGIHGELNGWFLYGAMANNANAKTLRVKWGGNNILNPSLASTLSAQTPLRLQNSGYVNKQTGFGTASTTQNGTTTGTLNPYTVNTAADVTILITMQLANAADNMKLANYHLNVFP